MIATENVQFRLARRPTGLPTRDDWTMTTEPARAPAAGEVLVEVLAISLDPAMRGWMNDAKSYIEPVAIGDVMRAGGVGRVVESADEALAVGTYVSGALGVQRYATVPARSLTAIDLHVAPLTAYLNVLGMPGMTAYFGLHDVGAVKTGDTVVVSGAAGAVGMTVGQLAKIAGCRVVGIAGGPRKCAFVRDELGFDAAIDYKSESLPKALREHCPRGIDVYFDNVGGETLDAALAQLALRARVVICGAISQYNATKKIAGPSNYLSLLVNRARMEGMIVFDYAPRYGEAVREMSGYLREGKLVSREDVVRGLETFPDTFLRLFRGENLGKLVLQVRNA